MTANAEAGETDAPPLGNPTYLYVAHYRLSSLTDLLQTQVLPLVDAQPKATVCARTVQGFLVRALAWALSLRKLSEVVDFQAQSSGCRALFEMSVDLALLVSGAESAEKLLAWEECAKLSDARAAQAMPLGQPTMVDLAQQDFIRQHAAPCAQHMTKYWPGSKKKQPQRWTGHQLAQDAATADGLFGRECFQFTAFAREHYARLNWAVHGSSLVLLRTLNDAEFPAVSVIALGESFAVLANIIRLGLAHFSLFGSDWEERIYAAKASGPVAAYRREMDAIVARASA